VAPAGGGGAADAGPAYPTLGQPPGRILP
jgi:hypothetical protein